MPSRLPGRPLLPLWPLICLPLSVGACNTSQPTNPSFPLTFDQADRALAQMRTHPKPLARPLVVVGGFLDFNFSPPLLKAHFHGLTGDERIVTVSVGGCGSFDECRRRVIEAVDKAYPCSDPNWTSEVDVVGASLGGLVARYAAAPSDDASHPRRLKVAHLFTISSPHAGATLAQAVGFTHYHDDMKPGSAFLHFVAVADASAAYELVPYVRLHDEIVGEQYAAPPGQTAYWLSNPPLNLSHLGAMTDLRILADIARRLRGETPFTLPPPAPLPGTATQANSAPPQVPHDGGSHG